MIVNFALKLRNDRALLVDHHNSRLFTSLPHTYIHRLTRPAQHTMSTDNHAPVSLATSLPPGDEPAAKRLRGADGVVFRALKEYTEADLATMETGFKNHHLAKHKVAGVVPLAKRASWQWVTTGGTASDARSFRPCEPAGDGGEWKDATIDLPPDHYTVFPAPGEIGSAHLVQVSLRVPFAGIDALLKDKNLYKESANGAADSLYHAQDASTQFMLDMFWLYGTALPAALSDPQNVAKLGAAKAMKKAKKMAETVRASIYRDSGRPDYIKTPVQVREDAKGVVHASVSFGFYMAPFEATDGRAGPPTETLGTISDALPADMANPRLAVYSAANRDAVCKTGLFRGLATESGMERQRDLPLSLLMPKSLIATKSGGFAKLFMRSARPMRLSMAYSAKSNLVSNREYATFLVLFVSASGGAGGDAPDDGELAVYGAVAGDGAIYP